jgi:ubiquinone/menaquinone biosynthesis C-methylase UbiE
MKFKRDFLKSYLKVAPLALASERALECEILSLQKFEPPLLDIGCGDGIFASILFESKVDTGIDLDLYELARCKKLNIYKELIACQGAEIPKPDQSYKTIMSNSVLEHIKDLKPLLSEVSRLLQKEGSFYVTIPNNKFEEAAVISRILNKINLINIKKRFNVFYNKFWRHYNCYELEKWIEVFNEAGFKVVSYTEYNSMALATFHDICVPFAFSSFLARKYLERWFFFPKVRFLFSHLLYILITPLIKVLKGGNKQPTLIFFHLKRNTE